MPVGVAVDVDDPPCFVEWHVKPKRLQLRLELDRPHAVARTENCGLTHEPLVLGHVVHSHAVYSRRHLLVDVLFVSKGSDEVLLLRQPCQHPRFDLCRVSLDDSVALWCDDRLLQRLGVGPAAWQVLQVDLVVAAPPTSMRSIITHRDRQLATAGDVNEPLRPCFFQCGLGAEPRRHE